MGERRMMNQSTAFKMDTQRLTSHEDLNALQKQIRESHDPNRLEIIVCHGTGCKLNGSPKVYRALKKALEKAGIDAKIMPGIKSTGCQGFCSRGPLVQIKPQGLFYQHVNPEDAEEIVQKSIIGNEPIDRLLYKDPKTGETHLT